jgi:hypothetical protein
LEKPFQVDAADGGGGSLKALAHRDLFAHLVHPLGRNVEVSEGAVLRALALGRVPRCARNDNLGGESKAADKSVGPPLGQKALASSLNFQCVDRRPERSLA